MLVVAAELCQHLHGGDVLLVVVFQALVTGDIADGSERRSPDLSRFSDTANGPSIDVSIIETETFKSLAAFLTLG